MTSLRLRTTLAVIFGGFTLGFYVAIQGPTLMDLIDLMHINNDIMSFSLAFASLAYSVGGLLSGILFNYVNRQILISIYFVIFGLANIATPYMSNYIVFSVITVFKMMCAGGTDCGANVWILEMWPGKDAWLQALHFSFAVGCALGPLLVEPFLSEDPIRGEGALAAEGLDRIRDKTSGSTTISDKPNESRIHIPYAVSGLASLFASAYILYLYFLDKRLKAEAAKLRAKQQAAAGEYILLNALQHPAALEAGQTVAANQEHQQASHCCPTIAEANEEGGETTKFLSSNPTNNQQQAQQQTHQPPVTQSDQVQVDTGVVLQVGQLKQNQEIATIQQVQENQDVSKQQNEANSKTQQPIKQQPPAVVKISSKAREQEGRPPNYVIFATALAAMCLSFYCGIEITSMNYLATFAVNIDLQLPKTTAALMSSALTISFAVGRGLGIVVANHMKPHKLFYSCCAIMAVGNIAMFMVANTAETALWFSICLFGIGCGPMFPAIVSFFDDKISKVTNTISGIFILGSMFNVALNSVIIGHKIIDNALILIVCNLVGSVVLLLLFGTLHALTKVKKHQRVKKFRLKQQAGTALEPIISEQPSTEQAAAAAAAVASNNNSNSINVNKVQPQSLPAPNADDDGSHLAKATTFNTTSSSPPHTESNNNNTDNDKNQRQSNQDEQTTTIPKPQPTDRVAVTIENDA